ncbi:uncharacterized protein [Embiotoca jacksoni]|uniref:uncharacterized protein n=1 Tax=Embiotoca jacksoni TaxID=100190 RepID=UPI003703A051
MMEFVHVAVAVFSLLSVGHSAPVTSCESLTQPLQIQGRDQLLGKWIFIAESTDIPGGKVLTKMFVDSSWLNNTAADDSDGINSFQIQKMFGLCISLSYNLTIKNNALTTFQPFNGSATMLNTRCPDCVVFYSTNTIGRSTFRSLQILSRRSKVSAAELEEFKKQVECLNLTSPAILEPEKGFCPDPTLSQEIKTIDFTDHLKKLGSDDWNLIEKIFRSDGGIKTLINMISSAFAKLKLQR